MDNQSTGTTPEEKITELEVNMLQTNPLQPRGIISQESLNELMESIREQGILEPLVVASTPAGYQLIAGERRWRAAKLLGLKTVPVVIKQTTPQTMLEMSIVENVQREDLNPIERGQAYKRLIDEFGLGTNEVARKVGKSAPTISNTIRLLSLPDAIKDALVAGVITEGHVRPLISLGDPRLMLDLFKKILKENSTVRQTEDMSRQAKSEVQKKEPRGQHSRLYIPELDKMAESVAEKHELHKASVYQSGTQARVVLVMKGPPDKTTPKIKEIYSLLAKNGIRPDEASGAEEVSKGSQEAQSHQAVDK